MHLTDALELRFAEVSTLPESPGVYEIWAGSVPLKVGIAVNLRSRLMVHAVLSRQSGLRFKPDGPPFEPKDVRSTKSILAKHLYFDREIARDLDLTTEAGRRSFLATRCFIRYRSTTTRAAARAIEARLEATDHYRYVRRLRDRQRQ